jgi:type IV pilus assembly protein PilP
MQRQRKQSKNPSRNYLVLALPVFVAAIVGCSDPGPQPVKSAPTGTVSRQTLSSGPTQTTLVASDDGANYAYSRLGRRDPFAPIMEHDGKKTKAGERPPLERFNIGEFKLSGIVWGGFGYSAMLEGPDGKGYFVRHGSVLGPNRGVVKKITQNTMIIEEKYKTYTGETERKEIILELRKKQEETP